VNPLFIWWMRAARFALMRRGTNFSATTAHADRCCSRGADGAQRDSAVPPHQYLHACRHAPPFRVGCSAGIGCAVRTALSLGAALLLGDRWWGWFRMMRSWARLEAKYVTPTACAAVACITRCAAAGLDASADSCS
jgi:hypothetical protein